MNPDQTTVVPSRSPSALAAEGLWRTALAAWAIPDEILDRAPASPWVLPREVYAHRAERQLADPAAAGVTAARALEALEEPGTVLDVGAGSGAASLPLAARNGDAAPRATAITAVDEHPVLLADLAARAARLGLDVTTVEGTWPRAAERVAVADVVVCANVLYNVPELMPFVEALTARARRRVVVELTPRHPVERLNPLWKRFHGLVRPGGPTAGDALDVLLRLGLDARAEHWERPPDGELPFADAVAVTRTRLCLPPDRDPEVADALRDAGLGHPAIADVATSTQEVVTIWWPGAA